MKPDQKEPAMKPDQKEHTMNTSELIERAAYTVVIATENTRTYDDTAHVFAHVAESFVELNSRAPDWWKSDEFHAAIYRELRDQGVI